MTVKRTLGWILLIGGTSALGWNVIMTARSLRSWVHWRASDPSAAELYQVNLWYYGSGTAICTVAIWIGARAALGRRQKDA